MSEIIRSIRGEVHDELAPVTPLPELPAPGTPGIPGTPGCLPILPEPGVQINIRPGVLDDYPFIDDLQKRHKHAVGFMWEAAIKGHIEKGNVLVAEAATGVGGSGLGVGSSQDHVQSTEGSAQHPNPQNPTPTRLGYVLGVDRYLKRDELGIIYQLNVAPGHQRGLIGANLLKAKFEASAYGYRLYCCWCAQDLAANKFWEAMGFVPLAFRTGGGRRKKDGPRMHIFWQKRIRPRKFDAQRETWVEDDYPYWFPSQTGAGAIGEDRIVLPIPPGSHWSEAKPIVLPQGPSVGEEAKRLEAEVGRLEKEKRAAKRKGAPGGEKPAEKPKAARSVKQGGLHFGPIPGAPEPVVSPAAAEAEKALSKAEAAKQEAEKIEAELKEAKKKARRAKKKFDPAQEAFARELKDRWLEQVAAQPGLLAAGRARYEVSRQIAPGNAPGSVPVTAPGTMPKLAGGGGVLQLPDAA